MQKKSNLELVSLFMPILKHKKIDVTEIYVEKVVTLIKERAVFITDFWELSNYFFTEPLCYEEKAVKKQWKPETGKLMTELINVISEIKDFSSLTIEKVVKEWIGEKEIGFGKVMQPLRLAIVGEMKGPNIFEIIQLIGEKETTNRIEKIIKQLS